jgi:hypothetical protein
MWRRRLSAQIDGGRLPLRDDCLLTHAKTSVDGSFVCGGSELNTFLVLRGPADVAVTDEVAAMAFIGGSVGVRVFQLLRCPRALEGLLTPDVYDPALNPLYRDLLAHYGMVALPCRVGDPDHKGKVEAGIGHTQKTPLRGLRFETLEEAQAYLYRWDARFMRRYERASTLLTSNRDDRGKLLGMPPRSWRCSIGCSIMRTCSSAGHATGARRSGPTCAPRRRRRRTPLVAIATPEMAGLAASDNGRFSDVHRGLGRRLETATVLQGHR